MHRHLIPKFVGAVVLLTALGGGAAYAFTASNTVPATNAGEGAGAVSGFTVSNISYTGLSSANDGLSLPINDQSLTTDGSLGNTGSPLWTGTPVVNGLAEQDSVTTVSFKLTPDTATWAAVQLYNAGGTVVGGGGASNCGETNGVWTCIVSPTPMSEIYYLDVEAAQ